jgi:hypothetical protein
LWPAGNFCFNRVNGENIYTLKPSNMKKTMSLFRGFMLFVMAALVIPFISLAQDKGIDINVNVKKNNQWYQQPWVWIVGGAIFILLLVALLRGNSRKDA